MPVPMTGIIQNTFWVGSGERAPLPEAADPALALQPALAADRGWQAAVAATMVTCLSEGPGDRLGLRPDPVGDHHLAVTLTRRPSLLRRWLPR